MRKSDLIVEFQKRFALSDLKWNKFLAEVESGVPLKDICKTYNVKYINKSWSYNVFFDDSKNQKRT